MKLSELFTKSISEQNGLQRFLARKVLFRPAELLGFHILGDHFYEPIPNTKQLLRDYDEGIRPLPAGQEFDFESAASAHADRLANFGSEFYENTRKYGFVKNPYFRMQDALSLYALIRDLKISSVVEIGQGYSTLVAAAALQANQTENGREASLISIDPFDRLGCQGNTLSFDGLRIVKSTIQEVEPGVITDALGPGSLLITDSSHVFKAGSDVEHLFRQVYPSIPVGTLLHVHDIYTPFPTPLPRMIEDKLFFNEQDHFENFLAFNSSFSIMCPVYWLFSESQNVNNVFRSFKLEEDLPGNSFYVMRR